LLRKPICWGSKWQCTPTAPSGIKDAIRAGVDTIEHASLADEEAFALAKQRGTYFDMDIYDDDYILAEARRTACSRNAG